MTQSGQELVAVGSRVSEYAAIRDRTDSTRPGAIMKTGMFSMLFACNML